MRYLAMSSALALSLWSCGQRPTENDAGAGGGGGSAGVCPALGLEVDHHSDISADETWAGDGTVHRVTFGITVRPGATLTLAPCAVVKVNPGLHLTVSGAAGRPAKLVAVGTVDRPVLITNAVAGQKWGGWRGLTPDATFELSYTTLENGGHGTNYNSALNVRGAGDSSAVTPLLKADHLTIRGAKGIGLVMEAGAAFTADSDALTVTGGGNDTDDAAVQMTPVAAGTLPPVTLSGNHRDQIRIAAGSLFISKSMTLKKRAPYHFKFDRVRVTDPSGAVVPTLTIEPGVEARFDDYLVIGAHIAGNPDRPGVLLALGTAAQPITLTSSKLVRAAGDWPGVFLLSAAGSRLEHTRIEYGGGFNGNSSSNCKPTGTDDNAALFIGWATGQYVPAASDFVGVSLANSAGHGINAMWSSGAFGPDLTAAFDFTAIAGCRQTKNRRLNGCGGQEGCLQ